MDPSLLILSLSLFLSLFPSFLLNLPLLSLIPSFLPHKFTSSFLLSSLPFFLINLLLITNVTASTAVNENGSTENGPQRSLLDSLTEKLKTMENEDSPSDEESDEQNNLIFTETASSAGSE